MSESGSRSKGMWLARHNQPLQPTWGSYSEPCKRIAWAGRFSASEPRVPLLLKRTLM